MAVEEFELNRIGGRSDNGASWEFHPPLVISSATSLVEPAVPELDFLHTGGRTHDDEIRRVDVSVHNRSSVIYAPLRGSCVTIIVRLLIDSKLTFNAHVTALYEDCYFHLRSLRHIRRSLTDDMAKSIAADPVQSRLDDCNSLLFGVSQFNLDKLQRVQNLAVRLALNDWRSPIPHLFVKLHWLPIHSRIKFKISSLTFKLLSDNQPANLRSLLTPYAPSRLLRSSYKCLLTQPRTSISIGKRVFNVCAPAVWNSIPLHIRFSPSLASFKRNL